MCLVFILISIQVLPYDQLMQELDVSNVIELEDFIINECMYSVIILSVDPILFFMSFSYVTLTSGQWHIRCVGWLPACLLASYIIPFPLFFHAVSFSLCMCVAALQVLTIMYF